MRVRRALVSAPLLCGCLAGIYETWNGSIVRLIDACGDRCDDLSHYIDRRLDDTSDAAEPPPAPHPVSSASRPAGLFGRVW